MLIDEIRKASIQAMKDRNSNKRAILSVIITKYSNFEIELKSKGKEATDADLINIIQKTVKELDDEIQSFVDAKRYDRACEITEQKETIKVYLPKQLTEDEIRNIINSLEDKSMPAVMKHFKMNYNGQVDMSLVSKVARE